MPAPDVVSPSLRFLLLSKGNEAKALTKSMRDKFDHVTYLKKNL